jgi:hypothetical protein
VRVLRDARDASSVVQRGRKIGFKVPRVISAQFWAAFVVYDKFALTS